ncbi:MAG: hypothetical protein IJ587_03330, partial [Synergistaceae bacterium]|nr:hypothetical protein [Synergistaceae bacterium]
ISTSGVISGTPKASGDYPFAVMAYNSNANALKQFTLTIQAGSSGTKSGGGGCDSGLGIMWLIALGTALILKK